MLHSHPGPYLVVRKQLVNLTLHYAAALQLSQETAHTALALMDRCVMSGIHLNEHLQALLVCACLRVAAVQESSFVPAPLAVQALTHIPGQLVSFRKLRFMITSRIEQEFSTVEDIWMSTLKWTVSQGIAVIMARKLAA